MNKVSQLPITIYNDSEQLVNLGNGDAAWYLLPTENCERFILTNYHESFLSIVTQLGIFELKMVGNFLQIVRAIAKKNVHGHWEHSVEKSRHDLEAATNSSILVDYNGALHLKLDYELSSVLLRISKKIVCN